MTLFLGGRCFSGAGENHPPTDPSRPRVNPEQHFPTLPSTHPSHLIQVEGSLLVFYLKTQMIKLINIELVAGRVGFDSF